MSAIQPAPQSHWLQHWELHLPHTADFFHRGRSQLTPTEHGPVIRRLNAFEGDFPSQEFVIVGDRDANRYVLLGALTAERSFTHFFLHKRQGRFTGVTAHQPEIAPDGRPEIIRIWEGSDWRELLIEYAQAAARANGVQVADEPANITGYCSWYYNYHQVTETEFMANVAALRQHRGSFPARYVQIDDGYQLHHGDWLERNNNWPTALPDIVRQIKDAGMEAGIWLMPLLASTSSNVFRAHPDWFVRRDDAEVWMVRGWSPAPEADWVCLDTTREDVQRHLRDVLSTLREWGFTFFKLDGTGFSAPAGRRNDRAATGVSAYRSGLRLVRQVLQGCRILSCSPNLATLGLADHARVSTDVSSTWMAWGLPTEPLENLDRSEPVDYAVPCLRNSLLGTLTQWWQFDRWFRADPDVVVARSEKTRLSEGEARMTALLAILTGVTFTSDRVDRLSPQRLALLERAAKLRLLDPRPVDWQQHAWPQAFAGRLRTGESAVALFNLSDQPHTYHPEQFELSGACKELLHPLGSLDAPPTLNGHDAMLLSVRKDSGGCGV